MNGIEEHRQNIRKVSAIMDTEAILAIYSPFVLHTGVSMEIIPPTLEEMTIRISSGIETLPWLVYEKDNVILGFAFASPHRLRKGYLWSVETGIYLSPIAQGKGIGKVLYKVLLDILTQQGYYTAIGGLTLPNEASLRLHKSVGFEEIGIYKNVGFKLGKWWDTLWLQKGLRSYENIEPKCIIPFSQINL